MFTIAYLFFINNGIGEFIILGTENKLTTPKPYSIPGLLGVGYHIIKVPGSLIFFILLQPTRWHAP